MVTKNSCRLVKNRCVKKPTPAPSAGLKKKAKKLKIKLKLKKGSKRVWKKESVLKRQIKRALKRKAKKDKKAVKKKVVKRKIVKRRSAPAILRGVPTPSTYLDELRENISSRRMSTEFGRMPSLVQSTGFVKRRQFGRMPSLVQSTGFVKRPHNISMSEHITGMPDRSYLRHINSRRASPVKSKPTPIYNGGYYGLNLGRKVNPTSRYGSCGCNKKKKRTKTSSFGFF